MISNADRAVLAFPALFEPNDSFATGRQGTSVKFPCACPKEVVDSMAQFSLAQEIMHLNDSHNPIRAGVTDPWPRERIADWLDELHNSGQVDLSIHWDEEHDDDNDD